MKPKPSPWSPLSDRAHIPPDPFQEQDRIDAAKKEEAGMKRSDATSVGLHHSGPLGILPTGIYGRIRKLFGFSWRGKQRPRGGR